METPSSRLATAIIERLIREKFLTADEGKKILPKITGGKARAEDWRLAIEISEEKESKA